jgi:hypothetical protein
MNKSDLAIESIGHLICSALASDTAIDVERSSLHFNGTLDDFEESVTRALNAALHLVDYQDVFEIAAELQRKEMQLKGIVPPEDDDTEPPVSLMDWSRQAGKNRC